MDADINYLSSLQAVRARSKVVLQAAANDNLTHFDYYPERMPDVVEYVAGIITRDFGPDRFDEIPPHGRWQHFDVGGVARVAKLIAEWEDSWDTWEVARRLVDLFFVSVLLDAGAGDTWKFSETSSGNDYARSEGIAVASLYMFTAGAFSSVPPGADTRARVDGVGLMNLTEDVFAQHFQISAANPIVGATSRVKLLNSVGSSLLNFPDMFGSNGRPGNLVDFMLQDKKAGQPLDYERLWKVLQTVLLPSWPKDRTQVDGKPLGDVWPLEVLRRQAEKAGHGDESALAHLQPFHKLTQWLGYSLTVPFVRVLQLTWKNLELGTGLPEYRNGGLFVDLGVLQLKPETLAQGKADSGTQLPQFAANSDVIVEWRAMTVALLDELYESLKERFSQQGVELSLAQVLEAGTWKGGRELAAKYRPATRSSPILLVGDGTLF